MDLSVEKAPRQDVMFMKKVCDIKNDILDKFVSSIS